VELQLDVTGIAHGGVGVARDDDGRVVFVADAIPGERVAAVVTESKKSFARASATRVIVASPDRVEHIWPEASIGRAPDDRVGGAEFGHIALARQRALKTEVLVDALRRFGGLDESAIRAAAERSGSELGRLVRAAPGDDALGGLGWRTRMRLHVGADGRPGQYAVRSHRVVPVATLPLAAPGIDAVLGQDFAPGEAITVIAPSAQVAPAAQSAPHSPPEAGELRLVVGEQRPSVIEERVGERAFRLDDTGFWQVHRAAPQVLAAAVRAAVDPERFDPGASNIDLYGGVGLLAAALAELGGPGTRVETVESDTRASEHAGANLADLENAIATSARVDRWLRGTAASGGSFAGATIVLDPPRSGAGIEVAAAIAGLGAAQLVYVACDPVALARDTRTLQADGYRMTRLEAHDLFPHTHHVEAVATFLRD